MANYLYFRPEIYKNVLFSFITTKKRQKQVDGLGIKKEEEEKLIMIMKIKKY